MDSTVQTAQQRRPATLAALHQDLKQMAAATKSSAPKEKPVIAQGPVLVIVAEEWKRYDVADRE